MKLSTMMATVTGTRQLKSKNPLHLVLLEQLKSVSTGISAYLITWLGVPVSRDDIS